MTALAAVLAVAGASFAFRVLPLLVPSVVTDGAVRVADRAATLVLVLVVVQGVLAHQDAGVPAARVVAAIAVAAGLAASARGASMLTSVAVGLGGYAVLAGGMTLAAAWV